MKNTNLIMIVIAAIFILAANISYSQNEQNGMDMDKTVKVKDVVCGMEIAKNDSLMVFYNEKEYYFCSNKHMLAFLKQPQKYTGEQSQNTQKMNEQKMEGHNMEEHNSGMMGMSTPVMIILGAVMVAAMIVGMTGVMR
jgi:YHS domain-containing protein